MPQINVTISDESNQLLGSLISISGESKSGLAARLIDAGIDQEVERFNKRRVFKNLLDKATRTKSEG